MNREYNAVEAGRLAKEILHKWWILLLAFLSFSVASYYFTSYMVTPVYRASSTIFIGREPGGLPELTIADINLQQRLVFDYRELIMTNLVMRELFARLPAEHRNVNVRANLFVFVIEDSRFMRIFFDDTNPERAAFILNELSEVLIEQAELIVGVRNVQIVDYAQVPIVPISPNLFNNVMIAGLLGMILSALIILFRLVYSDAIQRREEIEQDLGMNVLAVVPLIKDGGKNSKYNGLVALYKPNSLSAESYRIFRTNLSYLNVDREVKVIAFTSPSSEEGKTSSVTNFAVTLAAAGKRILLIDCDLRKGRIHNIFYFNQFPGLTNYLAQKIDFSEAYNQVAKYESLHVMTSGVLPPNPSEILSSTTFEMFIHEVKEIYDYVLIDTPPVLAVAETTVVCRLADGVVIVATANKTQKGDFVLAQTTLEKVGSRILGVLFRKANASTKQNYYAYHIES